MATAAGDAEGYAMNVASGEYSNTAFRWSCRLAVSELKVLAITEVGKGMMTVPKSKARLSHCRPRSTYAMWRNSAWWLSQSTPT